MSRRGYMGIVIGGGEFKSPFDRGWREQQVGLVEQSS